MQLLHRTLAMLTAAEAEGFELSRQITPVMFESWMDPELTFCNTACAIVSMWLRQHSVIICTAAGFGGYGYFVDTPIPSLHPNTLGSCTSYEDAWLEGIEVSIKLLPLIKAAKKV